MLLARLGNKANVVSPGRHSADEAALVGLLGSRVPGAFVYSSRNVRCAGASAVNFSDHGRPRPPELAGWFHYLD